MIDVYKAKLEELYEKMTMKPEDFILWLNDGEDGPYNVDDYYKEIYGYTRSTVAMLVKIYKGGLPDGARDQAEDPTSII